MCVNLLYTQFIYRFYRQTIVSLSVVCLNIDIISALEATLGFFSCRFSANIFIVTHMSCQQTMQCSFRGLSVRINYYKPYFASVNDKVFVQEGCGCLYIYYNAYITSVDVVSIQRSVYAYILIIYCLHQPRNVLQSVGVYIYIVVYTSIPPLQSTQCLLMVCV